MKHTLLQLPRIAAALFVAIFLAAITAAACGSERPSPAATPTPSVEPSPSATSTAQVPTETPQPEPTAVPPTEPAPTSPPAINTSTPPPQSGAPARVVSRGATAQKVVTLTFDAGSDAGFTAQILDTLSSNGIAGAFGVTGRWSEQNPALIRRIVNEGHDLINHSYDHSSFTGLSTDLPPQTRAQRWQQLDRTEEIVRNITGASTLPYFRPPYGDYDASVNADVGARGYRYNVMWTVDSRGWQGLSAQAITQRSLSLSEPGAVYIFHVGSASQDAAALQQIINGLRGQGYSFVPLSTFAP